MVIYVTLLLLSLLFTGSYLGAVYRHRLVEFDFVSFRVLHSGPPLFLICLFCPRVFPTICL